MKIPEEILSFASQGSAGKKLVEVLSAAPEEGNDVLTEVVGCLVEVLRERLPKSHGTAVTTANTIEDLSLAPSIAEQIMFLHPRGKQTLAFFPDRLVIQTSKQQIGIISSDVTDVVVRVYTDLWCTT